jgi:hypothetical protein
VVTAARGQIHMRGALGAQALQRRTSRALAAPIISCGTQPAALLLPRSLSFRVTHASSLCGSLFHPDSTLFMFPDCVIPCNSCLRQPIQGAPGAKNPSGRAPSVTRELGAAATAQARIISGASLGSRST